MDIEKLTIHFLLYSPDSMRELVSLGIDVTYFMTPTNQTVARIMFDYFREYNKPISSEALKLKLIQLQTPEAIIDEYVKFNPDELSELQIEFLADQLRAKKKSVIIEQGLQSTLMNLRSSDPTSAENNIKKIIQNLAQIETTQRLTIDLNSEVGNVIENYKIQKNIKSIMTGYPEIDDLIGGFRPEWLVLVAALPKIGKTRTLINWACGMVKQKVNVLIFTLEVPRDQYVNLCMSCFSKIPYSSLEKHTLTQEDLQKLSQVKYEIENNWGKLTIIDTLGGCTPDFIQAQLEEQQLRTGIKYDVIVVDHGTMMRPNIPSGKDHLDQAHIAEDLREIARKHHITVLAAVQRKNDEARIKKAFKQSQDDAKNNFEVGGESIGRSFVWYQTADVLFVIQNDQPDSLNVSPLRFRVISRYGSNDSFELMKDFNITSLMSIKDNPTLKGLWDESNLG
jgi:hypothetical protein